MKPIFSTIIALSIAVIGFCSELPPKPDVSNREFVSAELKFYDQIGMEVRAAIERFREVREIDAKTLHLLDRLLYSNDFFMFSRGAALLASIVQISPENLAFALDKLYQSECSQCNSEKLHRLLAELGIFRSAADVETVWPLPTSAYVALEPLSQSERKRMEQQISEHRAFLESEGSLSSAGRLYAESLLRIQSEEAQLAGMKLLTEGATPTREYLQRVIRLWDRRPGMYSTIDDIKFVKAQVALYRTWFSRVLEEES